MPMPMPMPVTSAPKYRIAISTGINGPCDVYHPPLSPPANTTSLPTAPEERNTDSDGRVLSPRKIQSPLGSTRRILSPKKAKMIKSPRASTCGTQEQGVCVQLPIFSRIKNPISPLGSRKKAPADAADTTPQSLNATAREKLKDTTHRNFATRSRESFAFNKEEQMFVNKKSSTDQNVAAPTQEGPDIFIFFNEQKREVVKSCSRMEPRVLDQSPEQVLSHDSGFSMTRNTVTSPTSLASQYRSHSDVSTCSADDSTYQSDGNTYDGSDHQTEISDQGNEGGWFSTQLEKIDRAGDQIASQFDPIGEKIANVFGANNDEEEEDLDDDDHDNNTMDGTETVGTTVGGETIYDDETTCFGHEDDVTTVGGTVDGEINGNASEDSAAGSLEQFMDMVENNIMTKENNIMTKAPHVGADDTPSTPIAPARTTPVFSNKSPTCNKVHKKYSSEPAPASLSTASMVTLPTASKISEILHSSIPDVALPNLTPVGHKSSDNAASSKAERKEPLEEKEVPAKEQENVTPTALSSALEHLGLPTTLPTKSSDNAASSKAERKEPLEEKEVPAKEQENVTPTALSSALEHLGLPTTLPTKSSDNAASSKAERKEPLEEKEVPAKEQENVTPTALSSALEHLGLPTTLPTKSSDNAASQAERKEPLEEKEAQIENQENAYPTALSSAMEHLGLPTTLPTKSSDNAASQAERKETLEEKEAQIENQENAYPTALSSAMEHLGLPTTLPTAWTWSSGFTFMATPPTKAPEHEEEDTYIKEEEIEDEDEGMVNEKRIAKSPKEIKDALEVVIPDIPDGEQADAPLCQTRVLLLDKRTRSVVHIDPQIEREAEEEEEEEDQLLHPSDSMIMSVVSGLASYSIDDDTECSTEDDTRRLEAEAKKIEAEIKLQQARAAAIAAKADAEMRRIEAEARRMEAERQLLAKQEEMEMAAEAARIARLRRVGEEEAKLKVAKKEGKKAASEAHKAQVRRAKELKIAKKEDLRKERERAIKQIKEEKEQAKKDKLKQEFEVRKEREQAKKDKLLAIERRKLEKRIAKKEEQMRKEKAKEDKLKQEMLELQQKITTQGRDIEQDSVSTEQWEEPSENEPSKANSKFRLRRKKDTKLKKRVPNKALTVSTKPAVSNNALGGANSRNANTALSPGRESLEVIDFRFHTQR